jgi:AmmeMemoRadiSam system protein B
MKNEAIRPPAVAGTFYPGLPDKLRKDIETYLDAATPPRWRTCARCWSPRRIHVLRRRRSLCVQTARAATVPPRRVYLLGPAHRVPFHGVAMTSYSAFKTPWATIPWIPPDRAPGRIGRRL